MKTTIAAAMLAVLVGGCSGRIQWAQQGLGDGGTPPCPVNSNNCVPTSPESELDGACSDDRWIAVLRDGQAQCPTVTGGIGGSWKDSRLFKIQGSSVPIPRPLRPYCLYEWEPTNPVAPAPADVNRLSQLDPYVKARGRDCHVVAMHGDSAAVDAGWRMLRTEYYRATGRVGVLPMDSKYPPLDVRVAVVDSAPDAYDGGSPSDDRSGHGHAVGWLIREQTCTPGDAGTGACIGQVATHLALPQLTPRLRDPLFGGYFGYHAQMAQAIYRAVNDWREHNATPGAELQPRLGVNMSVAWERRYGGEYTVPDDLTPAIRAIHAAITHVSCWGGLLVAAAGNDPGGPALASGAMYPAYWETKPAPTESECEALEGAGYLGSMPFPVFPQGAVYQPLVHAVAGRRGDDEELANGRRGGRSRLAAPGAHAVAQATGAPTDVLTGTSASAASVTAAAVAVWGYRPKLTAPEVMEILHQSGVDLGETADFCLGGTSCSSHKIVRVNQCAAIRSACAGAPDHCPTSLPYCVPRPARSGNTPVFTAAQIAEVGRYVNVVGTGIDLIYELPPLRICGHSGLLNWREEYPATVCPYKQFYGTQIRPWTGPQPGSNPCPACWVMVAPGTTKGTAYLAIDREFTGDTLYDPVLRLNETYDVPLKGVRPLGGGDVAMVNDIDLSVVTSVKSATISFRVVSGVETFSTTSELLVQ